MEAEASKLQCPGRWYGAGTGTGVSFSHIVWYGTGTSTEVSFSHIVWYGTGKVTVPYHTVLVPVSTVVWYSTAANIRHICTVWYGTAAKIRHIYNSCVVLKFPFTPRIYVTTQSQCEVSSKTTTRTRTVHVPYSYSDFTYGTGTGRGLGRGLGRDIYIYTGGLVGVWVRIYINMAIPKVVRVWQFTVDRILCIVATTGTAVVGSYSTAVGTLASSRPP